MDYHCRIVAENDTGKITGYDVSFRLNGEPTVITGQASPGTNSATLNGTVNPNGLSTTYYFEYGTDTSYGESTPEEEAGSGKSEVPVSVDISMLDVNMVYHFRLVATNSEGKQEGADQTFATGTVAPTVVTGVSTSVTSVTAILNGTVNPNGLKTTYYFEYGKDPNYGETTLETDIGSGRTDNPVSSNIMGLSADTQYHFRLTAKNSEGITHGIDATFKTPSIPPPHPTPNGGICFISIMAFEGLMGLTMAAWMFVLVSGVYLVCAVKWCKMRCD